MTFICKLCNYKDFETASGLWKHNNNSHKSENQPYISQISAENQSEISQKLENMK